MLLSNRKILLIRQKTANCSFLNTSYSLALLSAILEPMAEVKILDNNGKYKTYSDKEILIFIKSLKPDIIGFNVNMFNAFFTYQLIKLIKAYYPEIPLVVGGIHTNHCSKEIMEMPVIVVKGEGDLTFPNLIRKLNDTYFRNNKTFDKDVYAALTNVKGILFKDDRDAVVDTGPADVIHNLDELPFPSHNAYNMDDFIRKYRDNIGSTNVIISQRGCPYSCIYCKSDDFGGKIREASPGYLVSYIEHLYSKFSYKHIYFMDNNFTLNKNRVMEFCNLFIKSGLHRKVSLECQTNILCPFDEEVLSLMKEANFLRIQFGIDRLTQFGIEKAKIRPNNNALMPKLKLLEKRGMKTFMSILLGIDFDNKESIETEYKEIKKIKDHLQIISIGAVIPVPGTELYLRHPEVERWYLRSNFNDGNIHYYDSALTGNSKVIELNLFNLPKDVLYKIIMIQIYGLKINILNLFGKKALFLYHIDRTLILFSYYLSTISPKIELIIFKYIKFLRFGLVRFLYDTVYYAKPNKNKIIKSES